LNYPVKIDPQKASGPDRISHQMLKMSPEKIAKPLKIIFNKSLAQGKYPSVWKIVVRDSSVV
jgi:methionine-rich copper-binding protein CopC